MAGSLSFDYIKDEIHRHIVMERKEFHAIYEVMVLCVKLNIFDLDDVGANNPNTDLVRYVTQHILSKER